MQSVPRVGDTEGITIKLHQSMGHFGVQRVVDTLRPNYWWKGMQEIVASVVRACEPCARAKAGFRKSGKEL